MRSERQNQIYGAIIVFLSAVFYSAKAIFAKLAYKENIDSISVLTLRMAFSLPFFLVVSVYYLKKDNEKVITRDEIWMVIVLGIIGYYLSSYFDFYGLQYISAGLERLILFIYPTLVILLSAFIFKRRIARKEIIALLLTYFGMALVFIFDIHGNNKDAVKGGIFILCSAITYAIYLIGSGNLIPKLGSVRFTAYAMVVSSIAVFLHYYLTRDFSLFDYNEKVYWIVFAMAIFSTVIPSFLMAEGMRLIGPGKASIIGSIGPVSTILLGYVFLAEGISATQIIGTILVLGGVLLVSSSKKK
ncbi:MAG TPA: DMT family transporter [Cytophagaceae bacterium]|jgi:drug/metabolite transporter (DMT)-like permease